MTKEEQIAEINVRAGEIAFRLREIGTMLGSLNKENVKLSEELTILAQQRTELQKLEQEG